MSHIKSREVILALKITDELLNRLEAMRDAWRRDAHSVPKGLSCSESKEGQFVLVAAESVFTTIPGACIIKGLGAVELVGTEPLFEEGASSKTLVLRDTPEGWKFSVKYVPPIVRERNTR
ncbi:MAG: hypothetical protein KJ634_06495 [Gammaproteobacteria bacterium]|nr:hypothetical protein [Gammaproteobacteria bacterium]MBU1415254.1 hypothetical protein [Gammaproteobacteria bacterium]